MNDSSVNLRKEGNMKKKTKKRIRNYLIRLLITWVLFGGMGLYLISINQVTAGVISFAIGLLFTGLNNLIKG